MSHNFAQAVPSAWNVLASLLEGVKALKFIPQGLVQLWSLLRVLWLCSQLRPSPGPPDRLVPDLLLCLLRWTTVWSLARPGQRLRQADVRCWATPQRACRTLVLLLSSFLYSELLGREILKSNCKSRPDVEAFKGSRSLSSAMTECVWAGVWASVLFKSSLGICAFTYVCIYECVCVSIYPSTHPSICHLSVDLSARAETQSPRHLVSFLSPTPDLGPVR